MKNNINTKSTSSNTAEADPIILKKNTTTRLIFKPLIIDNQNNNKHCIKGTFIHQKKSKNNKWEDCESFSLASLKKGEEVKLALRSEEVFKLISGINNLKSLYIQNGIPSGSKTFVSVNDEEKKFFDKIISKDGEAIVCNYIKNLDEEKIRELENNTNHVQLQRKKNDFLQLKKAISKDAKESFYQNWFKNNQWILTSNCAKIVNTRSIDTQNIADFLIEGHDGFIDIVEIKNPNLSIWSKSLDHDNLIPSTDIIKAITQVENYIFELERESDSNKFLEKTDGVSVIKPRATLIYGRSNDWNDKTKKSFRILNSSYANLNIVTYDQLYKRGEQILGLLDT